MSTSRLATGVVAAVFATMVSVDPRLHGAPPPRPRAHVITPERAPEVRGTAGAIPTTEAAPPADLLIDVTRDGRDGHRVVLRRRGYLVSLRHEDARAAGTDWAAMRVGARAPRAAPALPPDTKVLEETRDRLIWETTKLDGVETTRGVVSIWFEGQEIRSKLLLAPAPEPAGSFKSAHATCAAHRDGLGGFTVLCRFPRGVRHVGAANVTGARSLDDAWVTGGASPLVRLDLPLAPGAAEGRVIGLSHGASGVVLRAEAAWPEGEQASLVIHESERVQP
jgi:hypothetical protein